MTPSKITYTVGGKERGSITAPDGVTAVLEIPEIPSGVAMAIMKHPRRIIGRLLSGPRFGAKFPGDGKTIYPESEHLGAAGLRRRKEYQTKEGRVVIEAEGIKE